MNTRERNTRENFLVETVRDCYSLWVKHHRLIVLFRPLLQGDIYLTCKT